MSEYYYNRARAAACRCSIAIIVFLASVAVVGITLQTDAFLAWIAAISATASALIAGHSMASTIRLFRAGQDAEVTEWRRSLGRGI